MKHNTKKTILLVDAIRESYVANKGLAFRVKLIQDYVNSVCNPLVQTIEHVAVLRHDAGFAEACARLPELEAVVEHAEMELELRD